jgi:hypothetical protein
MDHANTPALSLGEPNPSTPGLWRLATAARYAGITPDMLARACMAGEVPVELVRVGPRLRFVRAEQFQAWLAGNGKPESDLFR